MVAGGGEGLHTFSNHKPRKVLLIDGEMDLEDAQARLRICAGAVQADMDAFRSGLKILSRQAQGLEKGFPNLDKEEWQQFLIYGMKSVGIEFVVFDNLSTLLQVDDENSAAALDGFTAFLLELKKAGIAAVVVHHSNKAKTGYRGSQKISVTFDVIMSLAKPQGIASSSVGSCPIEVSYEKARGEIDTLPFRVNLKDGVWVNEESLGQAQLAWDALQTGQYSSYQELATGLGLGSKGTAHKWMGKALAAGLCTPLQVHQTLARAKSACGFSEETVEVEHDF